MKEKEKRKESTSARKGTVKGKGVLAKCLCPGLVRMDPPFWTLSVRTLSMCTLSFWTLFANVVWACLGGPD